MTIYNPPQLLIDLTLVLQYDTEFLASFTSPQRFSINQKRARLVRGDNYELSQELEAKIQGILTDINKTNWKPQKTVL